MAPLATVKVAAVPIAVPLEFKKETVPAQEAAVPLERFDAVLTRLICTVSELARPMGGVVEVSVTVPLVVVWQKAAAAVSAARVSIGWNRRINIFAFLMER